LSEEEFVEKLKELLADKAQIQEIPRPQRYVNRPSLATLFRGVNTRIGRSKAIYDAT